MLQTRARDEFINNFWIYVRRTIDQYGDKEFVVTPRGAITFGETNQRANIICSALKKIGSDKTQIGVGLFIKNHCEVVPAMIGVLKSRNYFVPLDVNYPESTLHYMFDNVGIKIILTVTPYLDRIHSLVGNEIKIINLDDLDYKQEISDPVITYSLDDIVQILFTSGSTGQPKGAIETYRYLGRSVFLKMSAHVYEPSDRSLHLSTFTYSGPHIALFAALILGHTLCFYDVKEDGFAGLPSWIREQRITDYHSTTTMLRSLISVLGSDETLPSVDTIHFGAEKSLDRDIEVVKKHFPGVKYIRLGFSSTETQSVCSTIFPIDNDFGQKNLPCGFPYKDLKVYIWDDQGNPVSRGEEGEIVVYGDAMAHGYINNPELTNERFIPDPEHPGWQYVKTGDWGKFRSDGQLVHLGRIDNMVKIRGIRIELESIEAYMLSYPGIIQAASRVFEDRNGNKRLASYFVAEKGTRIPISDLRKHLADRLPLQQLPHYLIALDKLPLTTSGKVAINQLPLPKMVRPPLSNDYVPPADELEKQLLAIWEEQIGVNGIGVTDDFFEVGGDSLIGALLFAAIEEVLGKNLSVSTLLIAPTIRKQAEQIRNKDEAQNYLPIIPINTEGDHAPLFFIPGKGGYPTRIRHLAKKIDPQTPVFALQDLSNDNREQISRSIETMADYYLTEIKKLYPSGPYVIIGESLGGKIAYEMAQQLLKKGEKVPVLAMLDTYNMEESVTDSYREKQYMPYYGMLIRKHLNILLKADWQGKKDYLQYYSEINMLRVKRRFGKQRSAAKETVRIALPESILKTEKANRQAVREYQVLPYPGRVILFKAMRGPASKNPTNGWNRVSLGELVIHDLDCYHGSILFEPAVSQVAEIIQRYIEEISR